MPKERERLFATYGRNPQACLQADSSFPSKLIDFLQGDRLWVEKYEPQCLNDLAVHKRKVDDVRGWLTESFGKQGHPKHRVGPPFLSLRPKVSLTLASAPTYPFRSCWFRKDDNGARARAGNGL